MTDTDHKITYNRVMLKISGEALMGDQGFGLHPPTVSASPRNAGGRRLPSPDGHHHVGRLFLCGYVGSRLHNAHLTAIAADLMPHVHVASNLQQQPPTQSTSPARLRRLVSVSDVMLFLVNEFTLKDPCCLRLLQHAVDARATTIVLLRSARVRLMLTPLSPRDNHRRSGDDP